MMFYEIEESVQEIFKNPDIRYFYHYTTSDVEGIIEHGLFSESANWFEVMYELDEDLKENILNVFEEDKARSKITKEKSYAVIIGCEKDKMDFLVKENLFDKKVSSLDYIIEKEFILFGIDLETLEVSLNDEYFDREEIYEM